MTTATMTCKEQLTIPKKVRDLLQLHSSDKIGFVLNRKYKMKESIKIRMKRL